MATKIKAKRRLEEFLLKLLGTARIFERSYMPAKGEKNPPPITSQSSEREFVPNKGHGESE